MAASTKTWVDDSLPQCSAADLNGFKNENNNLINSADITPNTGDNFQTTQAVAAYAGAGDAYNDTGAANAYVLTPIGNRKSPGDYIDELRVRFVPLNSNTGASTINLDGIGVKSIKTESGDDLISGSIVNGVSTELSFSQSNDFFRLIKANPFQILRTDLQFVIDEGTGDANGGANGLTYDTLQNAADATPFGIPVLITILNDYTMKPDELPSFDGKRARIIGNTQTTKLIFTADSNGFVSVSDNGFLDIRQITVDYTKPTAGFLIDEPFQCGNAVLVFSNNNLLFPTVDVVIVTQTDAAESTSLVRAAGNANVQFFGTQFKDDPTSTLDTQIINVDLPASFTGDQPNLSVQYVNVVVDATARWTQTPSQINDLVIREGLFVNGSLLTGNVLVVGEVSITDWLNVSGVDLTDAPNGAAINVITGDMNLETGSYLP